MVSNLRIIWACAKKDVLNALADPVFLITTTIIPISYFFSLMLFILGSDQAPTAVVMQEKGPYAQQLYTAMDHAHSFRLFQDTALDAQNQLMAGKIVAVVTIPGDFDLMIQQHKPVWLNVQINNLNTDFTADIRRAVPLSITRFYAGAFPHLVGAVPREHDWYPRDIGYINYIGVSLLVIGLMLGGGMQGSTTCARDWEAMKIKEFLLSPASRFTLILGEMLGAFIMSLAPSLLVILVLFGIFRTWPVHWGEMIGLTILCLVIFCALGTLLGTLVRQQRLAFTICLGVLVPIFFISGPLGPVLFETKAIQVLASIFPASYAIAAEQHAFYNFNVNPLGIWNWIILACFALGSFVAAVVVMSRSTVSQ